MIRAVFSILLALGLVAGHRLARAECTHACAIHEVDAQCGEVSRALPGGAAVDSAAVVEATAHALSLLVDLVPAGVTGTFSVQGATTAGGATVAIGFLPAAGSLPFPLATEELRARLEQPRASAPKRPSCRVLAAGVELAFPHAGASLGQEA